MLTTAGDDSFSQKLKVWVFGTQESQSLNLVPSDPQLASWLLRITGDSERRIDILPKPNIRHSIDISWFERTMQPVSGRLQPSDIIPVISGLTDMLKGCYFNEVDLLLKSFRVKESAPEMMVALLRTTFPLRGKPLRQWSKLLKEVRAELIARQLDSEKILRGLI